MTNLPALPMRSATISPDDDEVVLATSGGTTRGMLRFAGWSWEVIIMAHDMMPLDQAVWVDPDRMSGTPCFRGSRLPVQQLFDWLADGVSLDEFIKDFKIDRQAAEAVLRAAGAAFADRNTEGSTVRLASSYEGPS